MSLPIRIGVIVLLMFIALSILSAGHDWETAHPRSSPTRGVGYELTTLAMIAITLLALRRCGGGRR